MALLLWSGLDKKNLNKELLLQKPLLRIQKVAESGLFEVRRTKTQGIFDSADVKIPNRY